MDARQRIFDWSKTQLGWRRDLLRRVAVRDLDDQGCVEVLELVLGEHGLAPAALTPTPLDLDDLPEEVSAAPEVLYEIGECSNVGAIASPMPLTFEPSHITLVYGDNGVGKSSYARIIKRIARSAQVEPILPNVFAASTVPPRAVIDLEDANGRTKHIVPLGDIGKPLLDSMTVFDGACANVYLRNEKTVAFTPAPLQIFARAARAQRRVRELLDARINALANRKPSFEVFDATTRVRRELDALAPTSDVSELKRLATLTADERDRRAQAQFELAAVDAGAAEAQARQRERDADQLNGLATLLDDLTASVSADVEQSLFGRRAEVAYASDAVELARASLGGQLLPGSGGEVWLRMWSAARQFVEQECQHAFPPTDPGSLCPLCQQELGEPARARLERLDQHVESTLERELAQAQDELAHEVRKVAAVDVTAPLASPALALLDDELSELSERIVQWLRLAAARAAALATGEAAGPLEGPPSDLVREVAVARRAGAARQRQLVDGAKLEELRREVAELVARELLAERWPDVEEWLRMLQTVDALGRVRRALDTSVLSHQQTELAKEVVTDELRRVVRAELNALGFSHLKVDLNCRTANGSTMAKLALDGAKDALSDVLSDSEQRGCALAFFLAESLTSASLGGLVFDDPATSFDVERVDHIARRVAELATKRRQVIVFTHNVVFAWCLQEAAKSAGVGFSVRPIARMGEKVGIVRPHQVWPGETLRARLRRLGHTLQQLEAMWNKNEVEEYEPVAKTFASDIREAWERAVEEELFRGVVMRFQRDVKAQHIRDVKVTAAQTQEVFEGMTETSPFHHLASLAKPVPMPSLDELKAFLDRLERFCQSSKKAAPVETAARSAG